MVRPSLLLLVLLVIPYSKMDVVRHLAYSHHLGRHLVSQRTHEKNQEPVPLAGDECRGQKFLPALPPMPVHPPPPKDPLQSGFCLS